MTELHNPLAFDKLPVTHHKVAFEDPFVNKEFERINGEVERLGQMGTDYYLESGLDTGRKRTSQIDFIGNPATKELTEMLPSVANWLATIPTAAALHPLYAPTDTHLPNGKPLDGLISDWFRNIADARGIRSRAEVMKQLLEQEARNSSEPQRWLSLASGAAQPVFSVLNSIKESEDMLLPHVTLADKDKGALKLARGYAAQFGLEGQTETKNLNVLQRGGLDYERTGTMSGVAKSSLLRARGRLEKESFDAVDAVGIFEYLKRPDWKYTYNGVITTTKKLAGAESFMQNAYELVKPGGVLILGNMLDTHPQMAFTLNVIQWPHIQPRSIEEMTSIMKSVGIEGNVDVYTPDDGVYAIYSIRKPE